MKLSPLTRIQLIAVLATASVMLGCEAPDTNAGEQAAPVYPAVSGATTPAPDLVTVTNLAAVEPAPDGALPEAPASTQPVTLSDRLQEVVKLAESGVGDDVILAFIQNSAFPFNPTPEEILYLTDLGISDVIITALVNHRGTQTQVAQQPAAVATEPSVAQQPSVVQSEPAPTADVTYNPEPQVVYSSPPVVQYVTPTPVVEYNYFYSSLAPYGSWVDVPGYGWSWQPRAALIHRDWQPYSHRGRWLHTDHGWYWHSDYSWGWAPFHYGRWYRHPNHGWHWKPGSVWAPAWVSWRYTDSYCGWAPLPPGSHYRSGLGFTYYGASVGASFSFGLRRDAWTFVPAHRLHDRDVSRHRLRPHEHMNVYQRSKVINNYVVNNNTIINKGVDPDRVPALGRSEFRKVTVRDLPEQGRGTVRPDRLHQEGSQVVVYRPRVPVAAQQSMRVLEEAEGRSIASQPVTGRHHAFTTANPVNGDRNVGARPPGSRPGSENPVVGTPGGRPSPVSPVVAEHSLYQGNKSATERRPSVSAEPANAGRPRLEPSKGPGVSLPAAAVQARPSAPASIAGSSSLPAARPGNPTSADSQATPNVVRPQVQTTAPQTYRVPTAPAIPGRTEPSRSWAAPAPSGQSPKPVQPALVPPAGAPGRQEPPKATVIAPESAVRTPSVAPQTFRGVGRPGQTSWNQLSGSSDSANRSFQNPAVAVPQARVPGPVYRQELPKPTRFVAPEKFSSSSPGPVYQPRTDPGFRSAPGPSAPPPSQSFSLPAQRPVPSYTAPAVQSRPVPAYSPPAVQSRPMPSYAPPAVQSRPAQPAPSFSLPASRPAPQSAPSPTPSNRSGNRGRQ